MTSYTKRSDFPKVLPSVTRQYCWQCHADGAVRRDHDGVVSYSCLACGADSPRVLVYDPKMVLWFDDEERLVHEGCGVFVRQADGKLLLFQRTKYPYLLTIPAGHMENGEAPDLCAVRETKEEIGIQPTNLRKVFEGVIEGDSCLGGADIHYWHAYVSTIDARQAPAVQLDEEGASWGWYDPRDLHAGNTVQPVLYLMQQGVLDNDTP